jgi:hypothetical protein
MKSLRGGSEAGLGRRNMLLTLGMPGHTVWHVVFALRHFTAAALVFALFAGGIPHLACTPAVCAADTECAAMHCSCCGPNCPWHKNSQKSEKPVTGCNQQCPVIAASKPATIGKVQPLAAAMPGIGEAQPFLVAYASPAALPIHQTFDLPPPTLLRLACALTI